MNQSLKSILALIIIVLLITSAIGWLTRVDDPGARVLLQASSVLLLPAIGLLVWADFRKEKLPDLLRQEVRSYFERDGLCFAILPHVDGRHFFWRVLFQNRYERPCVSMVALRPAIKNFGVTRPKIDEARIYLECPGAAFGESIIPFAFDPKYQGKAIRFEVAAHTHYPHGAGKLLRFRDGVRVGARHMSGVDVAITALSAMGGHLHYSSKVTTKIQLPTNVEAQASGEATQRIMWQPAAAGAGAAANVA